MVAISFFTVHSVQVDAATVYFTYYSKEPVSFYAGRGTDTKRQGSIAEDTAIQVKKGSVKNGWSEIKFKGKSYYVQHDKLSNRAPVYFTYYSKTNFTLYNERHTGTPTVNVPKLAVVKVKKGSVINGWSRIEYNGVRGYAPYSNITSKDIRNQKAVYFSYYPKEPISFYAGRGTTTKRHGSIAEDAVVKVKKGSVLNGWSEIKINGKSYFVEQGKLTNKAPIYSSYFALTNFTLYNERHTGTPKLSVPSGADVKVKMDSVIKGWSRVEYKGVKGYAPYEYVSSEKPESFVYYANKASKVYQSPSTSSKVTKVLEKNEPIKIVKGSINNGWATVDFGNEVGYILAADIVNKAYYFAREDLELRQQKSTTSTRLLTIPKGAEVNIKNRDQLYEDWVLVSYGGKNGYVSSRYLTLERVAKETELSKTIVIDPGHGGNDPGAVGNGLQEKDVTLSVGKLTAEKLKQMGYDIHMTRTDDKYLALNERTDFAYSLSPGVFVSLHMNAYSNSSVDGTETYSTGEATSLTPTEKADSAKLATFIQARLLDSIETNDRGTKEAEFYVIDKNYTRSVLVEMGFISNPEDANLFKTTEGNNKAAAAIAQGINDFYNWKTN
jgi:N-acetylmuramoyl-L-alanine amidase